MQTSANDLLLKLQKIKSPDSKQAKIIKQVDKYVEEHSQRFIVSTSNFRNRIRQIEGRVKEIKITSKAQEKEAMQKLQIFERSLKNMLDDYSEQSRQAHEKLSLHIQHHQQSLKKSYTQFVLLDKTSLQRYTHLNSQIESLISTVQAKQRDAMLDYSRIKAALKAAMGQLLQKAELDLKEIEKKGSELMLMADEMESKINGELEKIISHRKQKRFAISQQIHSLLEDITDISAAP